MKKIIFILTIAFQLLLTGCATVPMAPLEGDKHAKQFTAASGKANIYLYRNENFGGAIAMPITLNGRIAGKTGPKTYFMWTVDPGEYEITSLTENTAKITINTKEGENYFIWQEVKMGMWMARSQLHEVSEEEGRKAVAECKRAKSEI